MCGCVQQSVPPPSAESMFFSPGHRVWYARSTGECGPAVGVGDSSVRSDFVSLAYPRLLADGKMFAVHQCMDVFSAWGLGQEWYDMGCARGTGDTKGY